MKEKTIYQTFDGQEFQAEIVAHQHEKQLVVNLVNVTPAFKELASVLEDFGAPWTDEDTGEGIGDREAFLRLVRRALTLNNGKLT